MTIHDSTHDTAANETSVVRLSVADWAGALSFLVATWVGLLAGYLTLLARIESSANRLTVIETELRVRAEIAHERSILVPHERAQE